jgi:hypothetical protein
MDPQVLPPGNGRRRRGPLLPGLIPASARADSAARPDFPLAAAGEAVGIFVDAADDPAVVRAAGDLRADVDRVSGARPDLLRTLPRSAPLLVLVGTLGASPAIDRLVAQGRLDTSRVKGRWEASVTQVVERPLPGADRADSLLARQ